MIASIESFKDRQTNVGVYLLNRSGWIILSTYVAGAGSKENQQATANLMNWCSECQYDVIKVHGQWDGVKESSFLIFTTCDAVDYAGLAEAYGQDCIITHKGLVWQSGKIQCLKSSKSLTAKQAKLSDHSTIDGEFFRFEFAEKPEFDSATFVIDYESGLLEPKEIIEGFQHLINSGLVWGLQGHYGRVANQFIESGDCTLPDSE